MPQAFIGNPVTGENLWEEDMPINGISGWTAPLTEEQVARLPWNQGVVPAGGAFRLPGVDPGTYRAWSEGYGPETADRVLREPIRQAEQAVGILEGLRGGVPDSEINRVKAGFNEAVNRLPPLVQAGMDVNEADALLLAPLRDQTKALASRYRYAEPSAKAERLTPWERNLGLYQELIEAIKTAPNDEERKMLEEQAALTKAWLDKQGKFAPIKPPTERKTENIRTIPDPAGGTNTMRLTNWTHSVSQPITNAPEPKPGSSNAIRSFGSEIAARQAGLGSGDVVYLIGIGKVRLK